jgi:hypothetical protein
MVVPHLQSCELLNKSARAGIPFAFLLPISSDYSLIVRSIRDVSVSLPRQLALYRRMTARCGGRATPEINR